MEKHAMKGRKSHRQVLNKIDLDRMLEILSAFDRSVVELSMGLYNVSRARPDADAATEPAAAPRSPKVPAPAAEAAATFVRTFRSSLS